MRIMFLVSFLCTIETCYGSPLARSQKEGFVTVALDGQLGNQMFQIATAYAYALDHNLAITIPDFKRNGNYRIPYNAERLFLSKIAGDPLPAEPTVQWHEPSYQYTPIPDGTRIQLRGYFQSEKYFVHHRKEILDLFSPPPGLNERILSKHPYLVSDRLIVGVQIRDYRSDVPNGECHPTYGRNYYSQAVSYFPTDALFLVTSNNVDLAKESMEGLAPNIIYVAGEDYIEDFYTLTLCKSFIISNSSFGWWASWLCQYPEKKVIVPQPWFVLPLNNELMRKDLVPEEYVQIENLQPLVLQTRY